MLRQRGKPQVALILSPAPSQAGGPHSDNSGGTKLHICLTRPPCSPLPSCSHPLSCSLPDPSLEDYTTLGAPGCRFPRPALPAVVCPCALIPFRGPRSDNSGGHQVAHLLGPRSLSPAPSRAKSEGPRYDNAGAPYTSALLLSSFLLRPPEPRSGRPPSDNAGGLRLYSLSRSTARNCTPQ